MFRIGLLETGITCAIVALVILVPLILARGHARLDRRLKNIEDKLDKRPAKNPGKKK
jgi:hypothetical protein